MSTVTTRQSLEHRFALAMAAVQHLRRGISEANDGQFVHVLLDIDSMQADLMVLAERVGEAL